MGPGIVVEVVVAGFPGLAAFELPGGDRAANDADFLEDGKEAAVGLQFVEGLLPWTKKELFDFYEMTISKNDDKGNSFLKVKLNSSKTPPEVLRLT